MLEVRNLSVRYGAYTAPEARGQASGPLDARADVFSVGRLLTFLVLDREPGGENDLADLETKAPGLVPIVGRCTQGASEERYADMAHLRADLDRCWREMDLGKGRSSRVRPDPSPAQASPSELRAISPARRRALSQARQAAIAGAVFLLAAMTAIVLSRSSAARHPAAPRDEAPTAAPS